MIVQKARKKLVFLSVIIELYTIFVALLNKIINGGFVLQPITSYMSTKIRLQRYGKKGFAFYHVVVADSRSKRDGRFIEKLGTYNPNTNPATIDINFDSSLKWVSSGAEMSDTARAILSYKGVLYKNHLLRGVAKGALTEADVEKKFDKWLKEKEASITKKTEDHTSAISKSEEDRLKAEREKNEARAKEIAAKNTPAEEPVEEAPAAGSTPEATETEEAPKAEEKKEEVKAEEAPKVEEKKEEVKAEETPKNEVKAEETATPVPDPKKNPVEEAAKEAKAEDKKEDKTEDK